MGEGVLQFTLGLATGNFLAALSGAGSGIKEFLGGLLSLGAIAEGVAAAFEKGAGLEALHRRTGQSVQDLYELQKGFESAGLSGDDVQSTLLHMQRAIGGVNDMGERTPDIFARLGLNIEDLRKQNAPAQLQAIVGALSTLNTTSAANVGGSIFGRQDFANIIQLTNSTKELGEGMAEAAESGKNWERVSAAFHQIEISWNRLKGIGSGFFAGIAEGLVMPLQKALDLLNSFRGQLTQVGQSLGHLFTGMSQAFKEGKLLELLEMTFSAGVEFFTNLLGGTIGSESFWSGVFKIMAGAFAVQFLGCLKITTSIGQVLIAAFDTAFQKLYEMIGKVPFLAQKTGLYGFKASSFDKNFKNEITKGAGGQSAIDDMLRGSMGILADGTKQVGTTVANAAKNATQGKDQDALRKFYGGLVDRGTSALPGSAATKGTQGADMEKMQGHKLEANEFEKMGFVMGGANNPMLDFARRTAIATEKLANAAGGGGTPPPAAPVNAV